VPIGSPYAGNPIAFRVDGPADVAFEYMADGELRTGKIEYTGESLNNLTLLVDADTGLARLENTSPFAVSIDGYTVASSSQSLSVANWQSLDDQNAANGTWAEANATAGRISELQSAGDTQLSPGDSYELGQLFDAAGDQDLVFDFLLAGSATSLRGVVLYTDVSLPGDYNDDGLVDAADYTIWRDTLNQAVARGTGADGDRDGFVTAADFAVWKINFGESLATNGGGASTTAVPEPTTWLLALICVTSASIARLRRS
jgi:hypothetical protein